MTSAETGKLPRDFKSIKEFYEYKARNIDLKNEIIDAKWNAGVLLDLIPRDLKINTVLEIGCGHGLMLANVCKTLAASQKIGVDISETILAVAKKEFPDGEFFLTNGKHLPFKEGSIDLAVFCDVLEHFEEPEKALIEAERISKYIAIKIPLERCIKTMFLELIAKNRFGLSNPSGHLQGWAKKEALKLFENAGLQLISYKIASPSTQLRYREERFKGSWLKPLATFLEKTTYRYIKKLHLILFGSDLFAFCKKR